MLKIKSLVVSLNKRISIKNKVNFYSNVSSHITICEVGPRDGLQNEKVSNICSLLNIDLKFLLIF
jgi:hypothetical protein